MLELAHPLHRRCLRPLAQSYYWTASATEYATDLLFRDAGALAALYSRLVHHGLRTFGSPDVMRFLGRKVPTLHGHVGIQGGNHQRPGHTGQEGMRVKHSLNGNSIRDLDKEGSVLRIETTINRTEEFKVYRTKQGDPEGEKAWRELQRGVGDLARIFHDASDSEAPSVDGMGKRVRFLCLNSSDALTTRDSRPSGSRRRVFP